MEASYRNLNPRMAGTPMNRVRVYFGCSFHRRGNIMRYLLAFIAVVLMASTADAQLSISFGFNLDRQPVWGPTGYDHVEFYYLPDIGVYYNVPQRRYYYNERGRWIYSSRLPSRYRGFDLYNSYKVVLNERAP